MSEIHTIPIKITSYGFIQIKSDDYYKSFGLANNLNYKQIRKYFKEEFGFAEVTVFQQDDVKGYLEENNGQGD